MRGVVLNIRRRADKSDLLNNIKYFFRRWGLPSGFILLIITGLAAGCRLSVQVDESILGRLDFLFVTNLPERLDGGFPAAFSASFASDFLFVAAAFLMGLCPWGAPVLPALAFFKGLGVGISAGYLIVSYGAGGLLFYLCVLVPGLLVFTAALVWQLCSSCEVYRRLLSVLFIRNSIGFSECFRLYVIRSAKSLVIALCAALIDSLLWIAFAGAFHLV